MGPVGPTKVQHQNHAFWLSFSCRLICLYIYTNHAARVVTERCLKTEHWGGFSSLIMDGMKEKMGCIKIGICPPLRIRGPEMGKKAGHGCFSFRRWIQYVWNFCKEDSNRVIFSLKAGFAVLLASLLVLVQVPYETLGTHVIWAIITVAIMFEYTVGMNLSIYSHNIYILHKTT